MSHTRILFVAKWAKILPKNKNTLTPTNGVFIFPFFVLKISRDLTPKKKKI